MKKIRKGDTVILIAGRDKGRRGAVIEVLADDRVRVEGLNMAKKHQSPNPNANRRAASSSARRRCTSPTWRSTTRRRRRRDRIGFKSLEDGRKVRVFKSNQEMVDPK